MSLFNKMFDTRTLVQVIGALCALLVMKAAGAYFGFSWMAAIAGGDDHPYRQGHRPVEGGPSVLDMNNDPHRK